MTSLPQILLIAASVLTVALSVVANTVVGYELGAKWLAVKSWTIGEHEGGALSLAAAGAGFAVLKACLAIQWARGPFSLLGAVFAFVLWLACVVYSCAAVVGFWIGPVVHPDAPAPVVALFAGLWLLIEIAAGLLPAIAWQGKDVTTPVTTPRDPIKLGEVSEATLPLPAILDQLSRRNLHALLLRLVAGPAEHGVQVRSDGSLVTTQRCLAALAGIAAGQVNKELHRLQEEGAITLTTSSRRTIIGIRSYSSDNRYLSSRKR